MLLKIASYGWISFWKGRSFHWLPKWPRATVPHVLRIPGFTEHSSLCWSGEWSWLSFSFTEDAEHLLVRLFAWTALSNLLSTSRGFYQSMPFHLRQARSCWGATFGVCSAGLRRPGDTGLSFSTPFSSVWYFLLNPTWYYSHNLKKLVHFKDKNKIHGKDNGRSKSE